ncbi:protein argonaute 4B-like [Pyrus ussuriensis x Pyrus communis]|uniref:Autophagy-related protein n=1 Tax=Pyrus ussuriensis x Pyrus communis TaxID=2448454 RepID=A0A5N5FD22_9ROSA|nr:protein argonaute 4B-like [Pyrus ussuriensis x Pyrus communis]
MEERGEFYLEVDCPDGLLFYFCIILPMSSLLVKKLFSILRVLSPLEHKIAKKSSGGAFGFYVSGFFLSESRWWIMGFRSWEMEFLNPEGVELPPPPPPPMIPPNVFILVAEEKPVELFANTSTPKLIPMARPDNGTKGQRIGEQVLWRERIAYCGGDQPFQLCTLVPLQRYTKTWHSVSPLIAIHLINQGQDNECDCIRNLQRDGVKPLLNASTTMIVKHGHVLDLLAASQIGRMKMCRAMAMFRRAYGYRRRRGGWRPPGSKFCSRGRKAWWTWQTTGTCRRRPIVNGQQLGNDIDLMREYHGAVAASLKYVITLPLQDYVSVGDMISHIWRVVDVHGNRALTVLHRITFMMRDYPGRYTPVYLNSWELRAREPDHIPVSVEKDASSDIADIDMTKYNVHRDMPLKEFVDFIRLRIQHDFPWNKNIESPIGTTLMSEVDEKNRDKDGFVRITYSGKEKGGWTR